MCHRDKEVLLSIGKTAVPLHSQRTLRIPVMAASFAASVVLFLATALLPKGMWENICYTMSCLLYLLLVMKLSMGNMTYMYISLSHSCPE